MCGTCWQCGDCWLGIKLKSPLSVTWQHRVNKKSPSQAELLNLKQTPLIYINVWHIRSIKKFFLFWGKPRTRLPRFTFHFTTSPSVPCRHWQHRRHVPLTFMFVCSETVQTYASPPHRRPSPEHQQPTHLTPSSSLPPRHCHLRLLFNRLVLRLLLYSHLSIGWVLI